MPAIDSMMTRNLCRAKQHVHNVCNQGATITFIKAATKDEMGTALTTTEQEFKSFPIRFTPYDRSTKEKISWSEDTDIICYISKKQVDDLDLTVQKMKSQYSKMKFDKKIYTIRYMEYYDAFANDFLYVIIGGKI